MSTTIRKVNLLDEPRIRAILRSLGFRFTPAEHAFWRARNRNATFTLYHSGKLLIQSSSSGTLSEILFGTEQRRQEASFTKWIGTDHAGTSDYFGPLTFAGVLFKRDYEEELLEMGIRDPKQLTPAALQMLTAQIKFLCPHSIVSVTAAKYNRVYERFGQHRILAWGHARVIENILEKETCTHAISHQFADEKYIGEALKEKGRGIALIQRHHAENNTAVAAASLLARESQKKALEELSARYSIALPRGAIGEAVIAGREFVARHGKVQLKQVAKHHFATTHDILNPESSPEFDFDDTEILDLIARRPS